MTARRIRILLISADYRKLWFAQALSSFGEYLFASTATVWVATDLFPRSERLPALVGAIVLCTSVPRIVVGPVAGVYSDRWRAHRTMMTTDLIRAVLFASFLFSLDLLTSSRWLSFLVIVVCLLLSESCAQFFNSSRAAVMQLIIPSDRRVEAASISMFSLNGVAIVATATGPALFGTVGARVAMAVCAVAYLVSFGMTLFVGSRYRPSRESSGRFWSDFVAGIRLAWGNSRLRTLIIGVALYGVSVGINNSVLALFGLKSLHLSPAAYGVLAMMFPAGNLLGAVVGVRAIRTVGVHRMYLFSLMALGFCYTGYANSRNMVMAAALMLICGTIFSVYIMCQGPLLQEAVPEGYMGRVSGVSGPTTSIMAAASTLLASQALSFFDLRGIQAGSGRWDDPYRLLIISGASFLLVGGAIMFFAHFRSQRSVRATQGSGIVV